MFHLRVESGVRIVFARRGGHALCRAIVTRLFKQTLRPKIKGLLDTCILRYLRFYLFSPATRTLQDVLKEGLNFKGPIGCIRAHTPPQILPSDPSIDK